MQKLTEEELNQYAESLFSSDNEYERFKQEKSIVNKYDIFKKKLYKNMQVMQRSYETLEKTSTNISMKISLLSKIYNQAFRITEASHSMAILCQQNISMGDRAFNQNRRVVFENKVGIKIQVIKKGILHIVLPYMLPHRISIDAATGKLKCYEPRNIEYEKKSLTEAITEFIENGRPVIYDSKVVLYFLTYFVNSSNTSDCDNLDQKAVTDIISAYYLRDDNKERVSHFMDSRKGEYNHTEIFMVPVNDFAEFYEELNNKR